MTVLITGGTGKTGSALATRLHRDNVSVLIASRSGTAPVPFKGVEFDWLNPATFESPFKADPNIDRVYLVALLTSDQAVFARTFIDLAISKGVKRFVLLSASQLKPGGVVMGQIHQYLIDTGVDYAVLRPTWFDQNFSVGFHGNIRDHNQTFSATGNGRIPFVSTEDIAEAAFEALTVERTVNKDILVFGPELYSHDEVVRLFSTTLGREITHKKCTAEELKSLYLQFGLPEEYAGMVSSMENEASKGVEEALFNSAHAKFVGKHTLKQYILDNRHVWIKE